MTLHDSETDARIFAGLSAAISSIAPVRVFAPALGEEARVAAGLTIYRNNVRAAYLRVLGETFPVVHKLVGEEFFRYLAHEYFHAHPPSSPLVSRYGDHLPGFLEQFEPVSQLPYLPDVARLELAWLSAYHAAEAHSITPASFFEAVSEAPEYAQISIHPSMRLLSSSHPVLTIWQHNRQDNAGQLRLPASGENILLVRPDHDVKTISISAGLVAALSAIESGALLEAAIERAVERQPDLPAADIVHFIASSCLATGIKILP